MTLTRHKLSCDTEQLHYNTKKMYVRGLRGDAFSIRLDTGIYFLVAYFRTTKSIPQNAVACQFSKTFYIIRSWTNFSGQQKYSGDPAVVAEWSKALISQTQVEKTVSQVQGSNPAWDLNAIFGSKSMDCFMELWFAQVSRELSYETL